MASTTLVVALSLYLLALCCGVDAQTCVSDWCWRWDDEFEYFIPDSAMTFASAKSYCTSRSATLAPLTTESTAVLQQISLSGWSDVVVADGVVTGTGFKLSSNDTEVDLSWSQVNGKVVQSCYVAQSDGTLENTDCTESKRPFCRRTGLPTKWYRFDDVEVEYGVGTRSVTYPQAAHLCNTIGGTLAFLPEDDTTRNAMKSFFGLSGSSEFWAGINIGGTDWNATTLGLTTYNPNVTALSTNCIAIDGSFDMNNYTCSHRAGFMCQRLARPTTTGRLYFRGDQYFTLVPEYKESDMPTTYAGVTPQENVGNCSAIGGEPFRFANTTEIDLLLDGKTTFMTTTYRSPAGQSIRNWLDGNTDWPIPAKFDKASGDERCYYYKDQGSTWAGSFGPGKTGCDGLLVGACQFNVSKERTFFFDQSGSNPNLGQYCIVELTASIDRPPMGDQQIELCPDTTPATLQSPAVFPCLKFKEGETKASARIKNLRDHSGSITFEPNCVPASICKSQSFTVTVDNTIKIKSMDIDGTEIDDDTFTPMKLQATPGKELALKKITAYRSSWASKLTFTHNASSSLGCWFSSDSMTVDTDKEYDLPKLFCEVAPSEATPVAIQMSSLSEAASCSISVGENLTIAIVELQPADFTVTVDNTSAKIFDTQQFNVEVSKVPSGFGSKTRFVCVDFDSAGVSGLSTTSVCFSSESSTKRKKVTLSIADYRNLQNTTMSYSLRGNGAGAYQSQGISNEVGFTQPSYDVVVSNILVEEFVNTDIEVTATLPQKLLSVSGTMKVEVTFTPDNGQGTCSLTKRTISFSSSTAATRKGTWTPTCTTVGTVSVALTGSGIKKFFNATIDGPSRFAVLNAQNLNLTAFPTALFINAAPFEFTLEVPTALKGFQLQVCTEVKGFTAGNSPISIAALENNNSATCVLMSNDNITTARFSISALRSASAVNVSWVLSGTAKQYLPPVDQVLDIRNQTEIQVTLLPQSVYFTNYWYDVVVSVQRLPDGDDSLKLVSRNTELGEFNSMEMNRTTQPLEVFQLMIHSGSSEQVSLPFELGGLAAGYFWRHSWTIEIPRVMPQLTFEIDAPVFLLYGEGAGTQNKKPLTIRLSHPPRGSVSVKLRLSVDPVVSVTRQFGGSGDPSVLEWKIGDGSSRTVDVESLGSIIEARGATQATINFTAEATDSGGKATGEVDAGLRSATITVRKQTVIETTFPVSGDTADLRNGRNVTGVISIGETPSEGTLIVEVEGVALNYVDFVPSKFTFQNNSNLTQPFMVVPRIVSPTSVTFRYKFYGDAASQYTLRRSSDITLQVFDYHKAVPDFPLAFVTDRASRTQGRLAVTSLPPVNETFKIQVTCSGCESRLLIEPSFFEFNSTTSRQQTVTFESLAAGEATITCTEVGVDNAPDFECFPPVLREVRNPSFVNVTFPTSRLYAEEDATIGVNITNPVLNSGNTFIVLMAVSPASTSVELSPSEVDGRGITVHKLEFDNLVIYKEFRLSHLVGGIIAADVFRLQVSFDTNAAAYFEYDTTAKEPHLISFLPRRRIKLESYPDIFYVDNLTPVDIWIEEFPADGISAIITPNTIYEGAAVWTGNATNSGITPPRQTIVIVLDERTTSIALRINDGEGQGEDAVKELKRYAPDEPLPVYFQEPVGQLQALTPIVEEKVVVSLSGSPLRGTQVIGTPNSQELKLSINRQPLERLTLTPVFDSAFQGMLTFSPRELVFESRKVRRFQSLSELTQSIHVIGDTMGFARNLRFTLSGYTTELRATETVQELVAGGSLEVVGQRTIFIEGDFQRLYVGAQNSRTIRVFLSNAPFTSLSLALDFSDPSAVEFDPPRLDFAPGETEKIVRVVALTDGRAGAVTVNIVAGNEFNPVINGTVAFLTYPLIKSSVVVGTLDMRSNRNATLRSDLVVAGEFLINEFPALGDRASFNLTTNWSATFGLAEMATFILENSSFSFNVSDGGSLSVPFRIITSTLVPFSVNVSVSAPSGPQYASSFWFVLHIEPRILIQVLNFPEFVAGEPTAGDQQTQHNGKTFMIRPMTTPVFGEDFRLKLDTTNCPARVVEPPTGLVWTAADGDATYPVTVTGNQSTGTAQCTILVTPETVVDPRVERTIFFEGSFPLVPPPQGMLSKIETILGSGIETISQEPFVLPFRNFRDNTVRLHFGVENGEFAVVERNKEGKPDYSKIGDPNIERVNVTLVNRIAQPDYYTWIAENIPRPNERSEPANYQVIIDVRSNQEEEPRGLLTEAAKPGRQLDVFVTSANTLVIETGKWPELLLIEPELITVNLYSPLFVNQTAPLATNRSFTFEIGKYVASVVTVDHIIAGMSVSGATMLGIFAAPTAAMQAERVAAIMLALDCPDSKLAETGNMETSLMIGGAISALLVMFTVVHLLIISALHIQRKAESKRTFVDISARLLFPAIEYVLCLIAVIPASVACMRVILYSDDVGLRIIGFLLMSPYLFIIPGILHGPLWRNMSLTYQLNALTEKQRKGNFLRRLMHRDGEWQHPKATYLRRHGILFMEFRKQFRWFMLFEYFAALCVSLASAFEPTTRRGCMNKCAVITTTISFQCGAILLWGPFQVNYWNIIMTGVYLMQAVAMGMITYQVAQEIRNDDSQLTALWLVHTSGSVFLLAVIGSFIFALSTRAKKKYKSEVAKGKVKARPNGALRVPTNDESKTVDEELTEVLISPRKAQESSDDDEELDEQVLADLEEFERRQREPEPVGVFRGALPRGGSFSPLRKKREKLMQNTYRERVERERVMPVESVVEEIDYDNFNQQSTASVGDFSWLHADAVPPDTSPGEYSPPQQQQQPQQQQSSPNNKREESFFRLETTKRVSEVPLFAEI